MNIAYIEWVDAVALSDWHDKEDVEKLEVSKITSIGFVVKETESLIAVSCAVCEEGGANAIMTIPKGWIRKLFLFSEDDIKEQKWDYEDLSYQDPKFDEEW